MKLTPVFSILFLAILLVACDKDKFQTTPLIEIKDYNSKEISSGEDLVIRINYFDKEGDLNEGLLTYIRYRTNIKPISSPANNDKVDTVTTVLPVFPAKSTGEISLRLNYINFLSEDPVQNDTMFFRIMVIDKAGNKSDTVTTQSIVALK